MTEPLVHPEAGTHDRIYDAASYDYELPPHAIAQAPLPKRDASRLLVVDRRSGDVRDARVTDLPAILDPGDLLVFNDTRVIKARLEALRADTGGQAEVLVVEVADGSAVALLRTRGRLAPGVRLVVGDAAGAAAPPPPALVLREPIGDGGWRLDTGVPAADLLGFLERAGRVPLPPYIRRERGADAHDAEDEARYQTVYAARPGAVAAPTAGLHFSDELLAALDARGLARTCVTLHVGPGTFRPVTAADVRDHAMHSERFEVPEACATAVRAARARGRRAVAVGTTAVRALESASRGGSIAAAAGATDLFLHPPCAFRSVDALVTNFHAPRSTLLMLVAAFAGRELILRAYAHAIAAGYRLLSYGDAMVVL
jgi:S-adenosylmethionine:tRNA ribosyltransferase-isomerase